MKKTVFVCLALSATSQLFAQKTGITITGKAPAVLNGQLIYLLPAKGGHASDSARIEKGSFKMNAAWTDTAAAVLTVHFKNGNEFVSGRRELVLAPGDKVKFTAKETASANLLDDSKVSGSVFTRQQDEFKAITRQVDKSIDSMRNIFMQKMREGGNDTTGLYARSMVMNEWFKQRDGMQYDFIAAHPDYYYSLMLLRDKIGKRVVDVAAMQARFDKLTPGLRSSNLGLAATAILKASATVAVGQMSMDFAAPAPDGKIVKLSDLRGKYVLLDFWASWCGPCRAENPHVVKAYNRFKDKNFDILGVSLDREGDHDKWTAAIEKDGLTWHHVSELKWWKGEISKKYLITAIPQNFLLDPSGRIIAVNLRGEALEKELEKVLQ
ncbi:TlpA disulfide reductase family protein [Chitinophaga solisilvae]|uniref:TlpA disulfide reductase family protein n=1 Tax=Chitinophaga solisilvae TaxID=1233460 RepID=UPI0013717171|nr:TlpA disulfide reductase family protein [Chitinophaga solisilvae]